MSGRRIALSELLASLACVAWVGGHAALGAFAARIAFRELPRALAADTMTKVFRSFDSVIVVALVILGAALVLRFMGRGLESRAGRVAFGAGTLLVMLGLFEVAYVHPQIEALFAAGRTLEPAFASLHRLSERCGHLEVLLTIILFGGQAWSHVRD